MKFFKTYLAVLAGIGLGLSGIVGVFQLGRYAVTHWGLTGEHLFFLGLAAVVLGLAWAITSEIVRQRSWRDY